MLTLQFRGEEDFYRTLIRIERTIEQQSHHFLDDMARWIVGDIRDNWSPVSPSAGGEAPAIDSGNLDSSFTMDKQYRSSGGRFASKGEASRVYLRVDTLDGIAPNGYNYAQALETGTYKMDARPFLSPALDRARDVMPRIARGSFRL